MSAVALVGGVTAWVLSATGEPERAPRGSRPATVREVAPDFELRTLDGTTFRLSDLRGRPVLVNFWASWCNPCREEFPLFARARKAHRDEGLEIVGVTVRDIPSDSRAFARQARARWPMVVDRDGVVARAYGVDPIPQTFLVRRDGTIARRRFLPYRTTEQLERDLALVLER